MANNKAPNNKAKYEPKKLTQKELEAKEAQRQRIVALSIKIFAIVALVAIVAGIVIGIVVGINRKAASFNYIEENLSKYIKVDTDKLKGFAVENTVDSVTDQTVRNEILKLFNTFKPSTALGNGKRYNDKPVAPGDDAYIFYRGYTVDADGNKVDFTGGSNLAPNPNDSSITDEYYELYSKNFGMYKEFISPLTIGSASFISGFELGIVDAFYSEGGEWNGKKPSSFQKYYGYDEVEKTLAEEGDYITISFVKRNNTTGVTDSKPTMVTINLADEALDTTYGLTDFASKFIGKNKGDDLGTITGAVVKGEAVEYRDVKVTKIFNKTTATDLVEVSYVAVGSDDAITITVDLANTNLDKTYGAGFRAFLTDKPVGMSIGNFIGKIEGEDTDTLYSKVMISRVFRFEEGKEPLTISVKFPSNYGSKDLAGKDAKFDVYIFGVKQYYDVEKDGFPTIDDDFITNEMKVKAETLESYEGNSLAEKYMAKLRAELDEEYTASVNEIISARLWEVLKEASTVKKLPKIEVDYYYNLYYAQLYSQYQQYLQYYGSSYTFESFAKAQGLANDKTTWQESLTKQAENTVTEKLAFYYVVKEENLLPSDTELGALCEDFRARNLEAYLEQKGYDESKDENKAQYKELKAEFDSQYTDAAVIESVQFEYAIEKLYGYASLTK